MSPTILQRWTFHCTRTSDRFIIPDGCQDLLYWCSAGEPSRWSYAPLQDGTIIARIAEGTTIVGYRFAPATVLSDRLQAELERRSSDDPDQVINDLLDQVRRDRRAVEAVEALAMSAESSSGVNVAARSLGVSRRTLERVVSKYTGRSPVFWSQLARVRAAARSLVQGDRPTETAYKHGYSDQAHLSRSVRRWFSVSPTDLVRRPDLAEQLFVPGYDATTGEQISTRYPSRSRT